MSSSADDLRRFQSQLILMDIINKIKITAIMNNINCLTNVLVILLPTTQSAFCVNLFSVRIELYG